MAGLLMDTRLDTEQRRYAQTIQGSAEHLLSVLNEVLDYSKVEAEALELESTPFILEEEVAVVAELFAPAVAEKGVELVCRLGDGLPVGVVGDPGRFRQVLLNLVGNAAKFTEAGWIEIGLDGEVAEGGGLRLRCTVADTGRGIEAADAPRLVERYAQADAAPARQLGGPGLGLSICRKLVEAMGGQIGAAPRAGGGTVFSFDILVGRQDGVAPPEERPFAGRICLVVDDLPLNREILRRQLEKLGARVEVAEDAFAGLRLLRAAKAQPYDMALIDRAMPLMDGLALARSARQDAAAGGGVVGARVLVLCASGRIGEMADTSELFAAVLLKPVMVSRLRALAVLLPGAPSVVAAPVVEPAAGGRRLEGWRVLLAEDNPTNQLVTRAVLEREGAAVVVAGDGHEAVAAALDARFDVLLMDVQMPGLDGLEATRAILARRRVPVIGLTAGMGPESERECREAGMVAWLGKPISREALVTALLREVVREPG
jgi:CheY-like chemotaxis protein